jgi:disulfide bond formation protein DsbB
MNVSVLSRFFALLTVAADAGVLVALVVAALAPTSPRARARFERLRTAVTPYALPLAWAVALTCTLGSLYYSEMAHFMPCELCWYQRIGMYPLAVILGIATVRRDLSIRRYVVPLTLLTSVISVYHYLLQRLPSITSLSCDPTNPCTVTWVWQFHFISIPFMALSGFGAITALLALARPNRAEALQGPDDERSGRGRTEDDLVTVAPAPDSGS